MEAGIIERMLRELPGVLDCSVTDEGVALVVHPEVDPRMIELRAKAVMADVGDTKPLLVVGGMAVGSSAPPPPRAARVRPVRGRGSRPPLSATGVVVLVVALLFVAPVAGRDAASDRDSRQQAQPAPPPAFVVPPVGRLPVTDEDVPVVAAAADPAPAPVVALPDTESVAAVATTVEPAEPAASPTFTVAATAATAAVAGGDRAPVAAAEVKPNGRGKLKLHGARTDTGSGSRDPRQRQTSGKSGGRKATGLRER